MEYEVLERTRKYLNIIADTFKNKFLENHDKFIELFEVIKSEFPEQELSVYKDMNYDIEGASDHHKVIYISSAGREIGIIFVNDRNHLLICANDHVIIGPENHQVRVERYGDISFRKLLKSLFIREYSNISTPEEKRDALDRAHQHIEKVAIMIS